MSVMMGAEFGPPVKIQNGVGCLTELRLWAKAGVTTGLGLVLHRSSPSSLDPEIGPRAL